MSSTFLKIKATPHSGGETISKPDDHLPGTKAKGPQSGPSSAIIRFKNRLKKTKWYEVPAYRLIGRAAWPQLPMFVVVAGLGMLSAVFEGTTFALLAAALDLLANREKASIFASETAIGQLFLEWSLPAKFILVVAGIVLCQVLRSITTITATLSNTVLASRIAASVQRMIFEEILRFDFASASKFKAGELTNHVTGHGEAVAFSLRSGLDLLINFATIIAYVSILCFISIPLFSATILLFGFVILVQRFFTRKISKLSLSLQALSARLSRRIVETITSLRLIHTYHAQHSAHRQVIEIQDAFMANLLALQKRMALITPIADSIMVVGLGAFLLIGFFLFRHDQAHLLPSLLTFIAVLNRLSTRISQVSGSLSQIQSTVARLRIVDELYLAEGLQYTRTGGLPFTGLKSKITFESVSLKYPSRETSAIDAISFTIPKGSTIALVGPSGGGKSSLADLLLGLYEPTSGIIKIDGQDLLSFDTATWRNRIGVVSQDTILFNATIRENISFARPEASFEEIQKAAQSAQAASFIDDLPQGYDTLIGERGFMLSGGQRQRLAIARALIRLPDLLILDEATSALDTTSEMAVQQTIDNLSRSVTRLVVAHRLSTVRGADKIIVVAQGRLVESGNHSELVALGGIYAKMWESQTQERLCESKE